MIKQIVLSFFAASLLTSCGGDPKPTLETSEAQPVSGDSAAAQQAADTSQATYTLDTAQSLVQWEGYKGMSLGKSNHNGTISLSSGSIAAVGGVPSSGTFTVNMTSIKNTDIPATEEENAKLVGHLSGADFFDVAKYPDAKFEISGVQKVNDSLQVSGNLTLKGQAKNITFMAKATTASNVFTAETPMFYINRKDWGINYKSEESLGDKLIRPEIGLRVKLVGNKN